MESLAYDRGRGAGGIVGAGTGSLIRPRFRFECAGVCRPCPFITCYYNLFPEWSGLRGRNKKSGKKKKIVRQTIDDPLSVPADRSCVLDVAEFGGLTLEEVGYVFNITRERVRQIQTQALRKMKIYSGMKTYLEQPPSEHLVSFYYAETVIEVEDLECFAIGI